MKALVFLAAALANSTAATDGIVIRDAWIREAPPVASVQAGYFIACNNGETNVALTAVESSAFDRIEMHETIETDSTSRMEKLDTVAIGAGECVEFKQGGKHLMLFDAVKRLAAGDSAILVFVFGEQRIEIEAAVHRGDAPSENHSHHGH
ncbi:MAG: copper chaperone PCu(A)C [Gammaproteobacteria bacterium]|nr:copper chaperone PCu(A)C [Gammaproteobacteria bacterium]